MTQASAPGKVILFGEHAVVYGRPAIAVPVRHVRATVEVADISRAGKDRIFIKAPDIRLSSWLHEIKPGHPLAQIVRLTLETTGVQDFPSLYILVTSTIPIAAGLGSGAAVSVAIARALSTHLGSPLSHDQQSALTFEIEKIHHGTPSGIDNTVITYNQPILFKHESPIEILDIMTPFTLVIGDSGIPSPTVEAVARVREAWIKKRSKYGTIFDSIGQTVYQARKALLSGDIHNLGPLMNHNQSLLQMLEVSSPELQRLIDAARGSGALGAKLSGAGLGGNVIALIDSENADRVKKALQQAGAVWTLVTEIG